MNEKKYYLTIILSFVLGLLTTIISLVLLLVVDSIWFIIPAIVGVFFMTSFPVILAKKNSYDVKEALSVRNRNIMQEVCFIYMCDNGVILSLDEYETDSDIGLNNSRIGYIKKEYNKDPDEAIYIDMNKNKFTVKYKKNKEVRYFKDFNDARCVIKKIQDIISLF